MPPADPIVRLALVRHGQSTWNVHGRWQGQADPPLSPLGEEQAAEAAERLDGVGVTGVVTSDLVRALRTGQIIAEALGVGPVTVDADLGEYDVGDWSGLTKPEIEERWPGQQREWFQGRLATTPGGEGRVHFDRRVRGAVLRVAAAAEPGAVLLVISHGGVIRALERATGAPPVPIANLSGRWFDVDPSDSGDGRLRAGEPLTLVGADHRTASPSA
ncbi:MAG: glucosyl-3-phosphoglycerate phosphatase [Actinomycetota bacterium]|jgi:probable phosphoglycerate mutase|nr:glucosyl-3-phosphoglycerate phosphatase [Actinomycetota bacterium]